MDGIAEWIEYCRRFKIHFCAVPPDIAHRQHNIFREGSIPVNADTHGVRAEVPPPGQTIATPPADYVTLAAHNIAGTKVLHIRSHLDNLTHKFVADDQGHGNRCAGPLIPLVYVQIGSADSGTENADLHVVKTYLRIPHSDEDIALAAQKSLAADVVKKLPGGYDQML